MVYSLRLKIIQKKEFVMKGKLFFRLALIVMLFVSVTFLGCNSSSQKQNNHSLEKVEYASQTDEKFYQKMVDMERDSVIVFDGFPTCLVGVFNSLPGDEILATKKDTVFFVYRDLNRDNVNNYPFYVIKDNNNNVWSIYRHNEKFRLIREDETKYKLN